MSEENIEPIIEPIVNLTAEIHTIIDSIINNYIEKENIEKESLNNTDNIKLVTGKIVADYLTNQNYINSSSLNTILENYVQSNLLNTTLENYVQNETLETYVTNETLNEAIGADLTGHSFKFPKETQTPINKLITAGYYKYTNNDISTFYCAPDNISYKNALIRVEEQGNHIIQYVHSTSSDSNGDYKIDGREFIRHGYLKLNNDEVITYWDEWKVSYLPWKKREDLLKDKGENVDDDSFHIYECTAGYVFKWTQKSSDNTFVLPQNQYRYSTVYTFEKLPIPEPTIFSNYIGHMDLKISTNQAEIRSSNNKGEHIIGVDCNYFVPRTN